MSRFKNVMAFITRKNNGKADIISWTTSPHGLGFSLFPRQRLILKLMAGVEKYERNVVWADDAPVYDEVTDLDRLINSTRRRMVTPKLEIRS